MSKPTLQEIATALGRQMTTPLMPNALPNANAAPPPNNRVSNELADIRSEMKAFEHRLDELESKIGKVRAEQTKE
jgi:outer membrane protein TolC